VCVRVQDLVGVCHKQTYVNNKTTVLHTPKHTTDFVKEYVNYVSTSEYGLDCQSRHSKSCVVNDGSLSTEVLRVVIGYQGTRS
jgi:hypothetical protein